MLTFIHHLEMVATTYNLSLFMKLIEFLHYIFSFFLLLREKGTINLPSALRLLAIKTAAKTMLIAHFR